MGLTEMLCNINDFCRIYVPKWENALLDTVSSRISNNSFMRRRPKYIDL